jgi:hypothetical protein
LKLPHSLLVGAALAAFTVMPATAGTIYWTDWSTATAGAPGSAEGTINAPVSVSVSYLGEVNGGGTTVTGNTFTGFTPAATFEDAGVVDNGPPNPGDIIGLVGGIPGAVPLKDTITFGSTVHNPIIAIWSLGSIGTSASFVFDQTPTYLNGGANGPYGGSTITVSGNTVSGNEGNGIIEFIGDYDSISWTNPKAESWYGFQVGIAGNASSTPTPEPASLALLGAGLAGLGALRRRKARA